MMKIDSQSMAVAPKWGQIYSKGAISIFTGKYEHLWQSIFSLFEYKWLCNWELNGMTYQTTIINNEIVHDYDEN